SGAKTRHLRALSMTRDEQSSNNREAKAVGDVTRRCKTSGDPGDGNSELNRKCVCASRGAKEAVGKTPARGTRDRIGGARRWARERRCPKPDSHPEVPGVDAAGGWSESQVSSLRRAAPGPNRPTAVTQDGARQQCSSQPR